MRIISEVPLTPKLMADAFWNLDSAEQAQFFSELYDILYGQDYPAHSLGEMQWLYMGDELKKNPKAKTMACAMMAPIFLHATHYLEHKSEVIIPI